MYKAKLTGKYKILVYEDNSILGMIEDQKHFKEMNAIITMIGVLIKDERVKIPERNY